VNEPDVYVPLPLTETVDVNIGAPVQVGLAGPNKVKVIVPVGELPPLSIAVSLIVPPRAMLGDAVVVIVGEAAAGGDTTTLSFTAPHGLVDGLLAPSPLYLAVHWYVPTDVGTNEADV
jgi:hypothetical protein